MENQCVVIFGCNTGDITTGNLFDIMPYNNEVDVIEISGRTLRLMFEHSVHAYDANHPDPDGYFLQVSGVRIVYDVTHRPGQRVASLHVASSPGGPEGERAAVEQVPTPVPVLGSLVHDLKQQISNLA